jgi:hypothetical protein
VAKVALARRAKMDKMVDRHGGGGTSLGNVRARRHHPALLACLVASAQPISQR